MRQTEKDKLAASVVEHRVLFEQALQDNRRKFPLAAFTSFVNAARLYLETTKDDKMIHRAVFREVSELEDLLRYSQRKVPDGALYEAERLSCLLHLGYDPYFEGDEPPGL